MRTDYDVIIVGGGLAGLTSAIALARQGASVLLLEKKSYPYHKVCGEYISNEVLGYLRSLGFDPHAHGASTITRLRISTPKGKNIRAQLDLGGFGISRYTMDEALCLLAIGKGAAVQTGVRVNDIRFEDHNFTVSTVTGERYTSKLVIGSWGKRETLDKKLNRSFINAHTGYMGIKYHLRTDYPVDEIGLDNFEEGYCGIVRIEDGKYNVCNFYKRDAQRQYGGVDGYLHAVGFRNPVIKSLFSNADMLLDEPVAINEISFAPKPPVEQHILMCGDSAGLITPLCGNGMSMAIGSSRLLTGLIEETGVLRSADVDMKARAALEQAYTQAWKAQFSRRLFWGRTLNRFFGNNSLTSLFLNTVHAIPPLERSLIRATHGQPLV